MDDEMEEFIVEHFEDEEIDPNYEFDASMYYDFSLPETEWEIEEAERWFDCAGCYPPSPIIVKLNLGKDIRVEYCRAESEDDENRHDIRTDSQDSEVSAIDDSNLGSLKKSSVKPIQSKSSTLMKPTASYLAKRNQPQGIWKRLEKNLSNVEEKSSQSSLIIDIQATKRQKLEAGYLRKVAKLKHLPLLLHKEPKKAGFLDVNSTVGRLKATIPKEPNLETAHRAQRRRLQITAVSSKHATANAQTFRAYRLNRKIFEAPLLTPRKKSIPQMPKFQVFHLKTSERAIQHISTDDAPLPNGARATSQNENLDTKGSIFLYGLKQEKCGRVDQYQTSSPDEKILSHKEEGFFQNANEETSIAVDSKFPTHKRFSNEPPVALLSKLSLASESQQCTKPQCRLPSPKKGSKENIPGSFRQDHEVTSTLEEKSHKVFAKQYQCRSDKSNPVFCANRGVDIH